MNKIFLSTIMGLTTLALVNAAETQTQPETGKPAPDFSAKEGLNFKLLADPDAKISTEYGSVMDYKGQKLAARNTFIINPQGEIAKVYTGVKPADHSEQILKDLAELKKS